VQLILSPTLIGLSGQRRRLSPTNLQTPQVGKYRVEVTGFEAFLSRPLLSDSDHELMASDEIGKTEYLSEKFRKPVLPILDQGQLPPATGPLDVSPFI